MKTALCSWFRDLSRQDIPLAGGKGANLGDMAQANLPVPPGFVICAPAYRQVVHGTGLDARIDELLSRLDRYDCMQVQKMEPRIRELFEEICMPEDLNDSIVECYRSLGPDLPVAVRSSATAEDLAGASFAGQQETFLNVTGEQSVLKAVCRCWSSLFTSQAIFYRCQHGFSDAQVSMAVVVQTMINSTKSGVVFTVDPVLGNHYYSIVEAVWGLGEGIVSGTITPDHYRVDRETFEIDEEFVPEKNEMITRCSEGGGVAKTAVPEDKVRARVLDPAEIRELVDLGNRVEKHFACPQDIEWAIEGDKTYLLQSRPITCM
jgi:pyruvate, water dikinase